MATPLNTGGVLAASGEARTSGRRPIAAANLQRDIRECLECIGVVIHNDINNCAKPKLRRAFSSPHRMGRGLG
jgi:hypothetical protein